MKFIKYKLIAGLFLLASCSEELEITTPEFNVTTEFTTYKKGQPVTFNFTGNPQLISVYTGEVGKDYAFKDGRLMDVSDVKLSFNSSVTDEPGTGTKQSGMFSLLASTNFNGDYSNYSSVQAATWTDITNRLAKQEAATSTTITVATPVGGLDLTDLRVAGKPLYIAFKYNIREQSKYGIWRTWRFQAFQLTGEISSGPQVLGNMTNSAFRVVQKNPEITSRTSATTATLTLMPADAAVFPETKEMPTESWIITRAFNNVNKIDFGPDLTIPIQGGTSAVEKKDFTYTFVAAGTYKVYFIASNANSTGQKDIVKQLTLTITD
jgi:predicted heme/steroid binding protein